MVIHAFGAYFGLALARTLYKKDGQMDNAAEGENLCLNSLTSSLSELTILSDTTFIFLIWLIPRIFQTSYIILISLKNLNEIFVFFRKLLKLNGTPESNQTA